MVVCKFYAQGNCKFGDRCWNEHIRTGGREDNYYENAHYNRGNNRSNHNQQNRRNFNPAQQQHHHQSSSPSFGGQSSSGFSFKKTFQQISSPSNAVGFSFSKTYQQTTSNSIPNQVHANFVHTQPFSLQQLNQHHSFDQNQYQQLNQPSTGSTGSFSGAFSFARAMQEVNQPTQQGFTNEQFNGNSFQSQNSIFQAPSYQGYQGGQSVHQQIHFPVSEIEFEDVETATPTSISTSNTVAITQEEIKSDDPIYSSLTQLNNSEREAYMASEFTFGRIPVNPPPIEVCF